jgi:NADH-quinone oxidoreductase subunit N
MDLGVFGLLAQLSPLGIDLDRLADLRGLARRHPWRSGFLVLCLFSLAGLPPTGGFLGKFLLFSATVSAGQLALAVLAAIAAAASFYYYFKLAALMYMEAPQQESPEPASPVPPAESLALAVIASALLVLGLFPSWLHRLSTAALDSLIK